MASIVMFLESPIQMYWIGVEVVPTIFSLLPYHLKVLHVISLHLLCSRVMTISAM